MPTGTCRTCWGTLAPRLLIPVLTERAGIPGEKKCRDVTKGERRALLETLKDLTVSVARPPAHRRSHRHLPAA